MGPHTFNFAEAAASAQAAGAALRVADMAAAWQQALALLGSPAQLQRAAAAARGFAASHGGAAARTAKALNDWL
jgi:3-deoxy-D-manno-octulosonic-acid transferase